MKDVAERILGGDESTPRELLVKSLQTMSLGELLAFNRFLALSTRAATLEATSSELERVRLDIRFRGIALETHSASAAEDAREIAVPPLAAPFSCVRYMVGRLVFANCQ